MEEDIKILEEKVIALERHIKIYEESDCRTAVYQELVKEKQATSNVLSRLKQLEEENKSYNKAYNLGKAFASEQWKQKVKGKIEELDIQISECEYADDDIEERKQDIEKEKRLLLRDKKTLEELLGEE